MLESLDISAEELTAVREKRRRLEEALGGRAAEPENVTRAMLDCGRLGDYETLLEQSRRVKQGVDGFLAEGPGGPGHGLAGTRRPGYDGPASG